MRRFAVGFVLAGALLMVWSWQTGPGVEPAPAAKGSHDPGRGGAATLVAPQPDRPVPVAAAGGPVFRALGGVDGDHFAFEDVTVRWDASCRDRPQASKFTSFAPVLAATGLDLHSRIPTVGRVVDFAQTYSGPSAFYQLTAEWNYDVPARYRIRLLRFDDALHSNPTPVGLGDATQVVAEPDLAEALRAADLRVRADFGVAPATRSVVLAEDLPSQSEALKQTQDENYVVELADGRPVRFDGQGVHCRTDGDVATCGCPSDEEPL
jgi:hypothetical protein